MVTRGQEKGTERERENDCFVLLVPIWRRMGTRGQEKGTERERERE
jgi:hypothetical protein